MFEKYVYLSIRIDASTNPLVKHAVDIQYWPIYYGFFGKKKFKYLKN